MPKDAKLWQGVAWEDNNATVYAHVVIDVSGTETNLQQAHLTSITYKVMNGSTTVTSGTIDKTTDVYDSLQTGTTWTRVLGSTGGNFRTQLPVAAFPDGDVDYRVEITFTTTGSKTFPLVVNVRTLNLQGS